MKNKRLVKYFFVLSAMLMSTLPFINIVDFFSEYSISEIKKINKKVLFNMDKVEGLASYIVYKFFDQSIFSDNVVTGKDDFLFLGNRYAQVIDKTNNTFLVTDKELERFVKKLHALQKWYENKGIKFVMAIAPNKHSIYKEKLPNWISQNEESITDKILAKSQKYDINLLDLRPLLLEAKTNEERLLYLKTDTHWNMLGASFGYEKTIDYINKKYELHIPKPKYEVKHVYSENYVGDLAKFLKIDNFHTIDDHNTYVYHFNNNNKVCHGKIELNTGKLQNCTNKENPVIGINWQPQYIINKNINNGKLLFLCDSFGKSPSQLYNQSFNTIWKFHYRKFTDENLRKFIFKHKPEIVLYQLVERDFYNNVMFRIMKK